MAQERDSEVIAVRMEVAQHSEMPPNRANLKNTSIGDDALAGGAPFLREVRRHHLKDDDGRPPTFPLSVPAIRTLETMQFPTPVTFFVGENGSGKSTLLEGIAWAANLAIVGSADLKFDQTLSAQKVLRRALKLVWNQRTMRGFFLRAEDFFGFTKRQTALREEMQRGIADIEREYEGRSAYAKNLALMPFRTSLADMERLYGKDLDENSHGQSFLRLFQSRFVPGGLYLMDEPEAPLSPQSQLALMLMMQDMLAQRAQFIIATHSPILLAFPGATIYSFDVVPASRVAFNDLEHVSLTRAFLNDPERYLRALRTT